MTTPPLPRGRSVARERALARDEVRVPLVDQRALELAVRVLLLEALLPLCVEARLPQSGQHLSACYPNTISQTLDELDCLPSHSNYVFLPAK